MVVDPWLQWPGSEEPQIPGVGVAALRGASSRLLCSRGQEATGQEGGGGSAVRLPSPCSLVVFAP